MENSVAFYRSIIDSLTENIAVIDQSGKIRFVNKSWIEFGRANGCSLSHQWPGENYMTTCGRSSASGDLYGEQAADGIGQVIARRCDHFYMEYPCHSPTEKRWFMMRVRPLDLPRESLFVITHQSITERKLAEEEVLNLSQIDGLTKVANRRYFDEFFESEWRRCGRLVLPVSLLMLDIDHFKIYNDTYGHLEGDECLRKIGEILKRFGKRPGDLAARYGGEEFVIVFGNTRLAEAVALARNVLETIRGQNMPFQASPIAAMVTVSIGIACAVPHQGTDSKNLIRAADTMLYSAKKNGRNRLAYLEETVT